MYSLIEIICQLGRAIRENDQVEERLAEVLRIDREGTVLTKLIELGELYYEKKYQQAYALAEESEFDEKFQTEILPDLTENLEKTVFLGEAERFLTEKGYL